MFNYADNLRGCHHIRSEDILKLPAADLNVSRLLRMGSFSALTGDRSHTDLGQ
jgi:hypothetical protein